MGRVIRLRPRHYFEPWTLRKDESWRRCFEWCPTEGEFFTGDDVNAHHTAKEKAERLAPVHILGSRMAEPAVCVSLEGEVGVYDDRRIIASYHPHHRDGATHAELAERSACCVNACRGMGDPEKTLADIRDLLEDILQDDAQDYRERITNLVARLSPPSLPL